MDSPLSPSSARKEAGMFLTLILLLSGRSLRAMAAQSPQGVECIVFNDQYLTCMWGSKATLTANYSLYYWYIPPRSENHMPVEECKHYLQEEGINTGCWFNHSEIIQFRPFYIHVNASHGGRSLIIPTKVMKLQDLVKPAPPVNLTIQNISNNQLQLTWDSMYLKPLCLEYAVKYKSNQDTSWTEHLVSGKIFSFPSVDYEKYYTFYVKSKINQYCGTTQLWSEWSVPVFWGNNATDQAVWGSCLLPARNSPMASRRPPPLQSDHSGGVSASPAVHLLCRHGGGAGTMVLDSRGSPHCLFDALPSPCHFADSNGKSLGHSHAQNPQPQQELRRALQHPPGQLPGMGRSLQGHRGEL
ncbi:cytokine receptor common subunit gamma isoform X4 [Chelonia mydas]|uniref:cytokine receptor common subunit gamma isoform X4 n=1 Tax=Chelonia mydas TaxID=8469 RepID=UPI001CA968C3|nr:cytokine receptor common subunit gamma isoform X4 [Chelonia mydas]